MEMKPKQAEEKHLTVLDFGDAVKGVYHASDKAQNEIKLNRVQRSDLDLGSDSKLIFQNPSMLNIGYILCHGNVTNFETIVRHFTTSVKSILIFSKIPENIRFRVVTEKESTQEIEKMIRQNIPKAYWSHFDVRGDETNKDIGEDLKTSLKFKGCGHLKMTFHHTFGELDSLLLLDADTLLLNPIEGKHFTRNRHIQLIPIIIIYSHVQLDT